MIRFTQRSYEVKKEQKKWEEAWIFKYPWESAENVSLSSSFMSCTYKINCLPEKFIVPQIFKHRIKILRSPFVHMTIGCINGKDNLCNQVIISQKTERKAPNLDSIQGHVTRWHSSNHIYYKCGNINSQLELDEFLNIRIDRPSPTNNLKEKKKRRLNA